MVVEKEKHELIDPVRVGVYYICINYDIYEFLLGVLEWQNIFYYDFEFPGRLGVELDKIQPSWKCDNDTYR